MWFSAAMIKRKLSTTKKKLITQKAHLKDNKYQIKKQYFWQTHAYLKNQEIRTNSIYNVFFFWKYNENYSMPALKKQIKKSIR